MKSRNKNNQLQLGTSKNSDFFVRARKHRAQNRSVWVIHEDSSTGLTPLSRKKCIFRCALLALICLPNTVHALASDRDQPIVIEAEQVEIDKLKGFSRYQGNVKFIQGSLIIHGGTVLLYHQDGKVNKVIIHGQPASFQQTPDEGGIIIISQANKMEYIARQSRLFLFDAAKVSQGNNSFSGEKIEYDIVMGTVVANKNSSGNNRIHAIIEPTEEVKQSP